MGLRQIILIVLLAVVAGFTVFHATREASNNANVPNGTEWRCLNPECGKVFRMSVKELGDHHAAHWGEPVPCPVCRETKTRGTEKE